MELADDQADEKDHSARAAEGKPDPNSRMRERVKTLKELLDGITPENVHPETD